MWTPERTMAEATLLPLFDREGAVRWVTFLDARSTDIWCFDPAETGVRVPLWGAIRVDSEPGDLRLLRAEDLAARGDLWHFDPWWLLADRRYDRSEAAQGLKATNCAGQLPGATNRLLYRWDLLQVKWVVYREAGGERIGKLPGDCLSKRPPGPAVGRPCTWRLDPFWMHGQWQSGLQ